MTTLICSLVAAGSRVTAALLVVLLVAPALPALAAEVSAFPETLEFGGVQQGATATRTIGVTNDAEASRLFSIETAGSIADWLTVSRTTGNRAVDDFELRPGERTVVRVTISVPLRADEGDAFGTLRVLSRPSDGSDTGSAVGLVVPVRASVVSSLQQEGRIEDFFVSDPLAGPPVIGTLLIKNTSPMSIYPDATIEVFSGNDSLGTVVVDTFALAPGEVGTFFGTLPVNDLPPGDYVARADATLSGVRLEPRLADFTLLSAELMVENLALEALELRNEPGPGGTAVINATITNRSDIETEVRFIGDLRLEGLLVQPVGSLERRIPPQESTVIPLFMDVDREGIYTLSGRVGFGGLETDLQTITFEVQADSTIWSRMSTWIVLFGVAVVGGLLAAAFRRYERYEDRRWAT